MPLIHNNEVSAAQTPLRRRTIITALQWRALLRSPYVFLLAVYVVSRVFYYLLGVRFDSRGLPSSLQFIDVELLRHHLLQSLFYLHWQPPGYNLFLGVVLKLFPSTYGAAFHAIHLVFGGTVMCLMFHLMRCLGVRVRIALTMTILFIVSPGVILYEKFLFYEFPMIFLLIVSAAFLFHFFANRSAVCAIGFLLCLFLLVLVRNQFHLIYFAFAFALMLYFAKHHRRLVTIAGSVFFAMVFALFLKNFVLFGHFASSTWMQMGLGPLLLYQMTPEERDPLIAQGKLSPAWDVEANAPVAIGDVPLDGIPVSSYRPYITMPPKTGIPVLDQELKSSGSVNYNHRGYLEAQKLYVKDLKCIMRYCPQAYLRSVAIAWFTYFLPSGDFPFLNKNLPRISGIERFCDIVMCGQFKHTSTRYILRKMSPLAIIPYTGVFLLVGLPALFIFGIWYLYRGVRRRTLGSPQALLLGFLLFNIFYITATANFLSSYENNRYRFPIDGFFIVLAALALEQVIRKSFRKENRLF